MAFTAEHASFPEKALQNKQIVAVTRELVDDVAVRNFRGAPFVCAIDSPELGTTRAVSFHLVVWYWLIPLF